PLEIESATGLSVYSTIPFSPLQEAKSASIRAGARGITLLAQSNPQDPAIESLRSLRTALQFALLESNSNVVMMTGPTPGVGKSFVSLNFADVLASGGKKILLVDADLHRGYLHEHLGIGRQNGLSEILASSVTFGDVVHRNYGSGFDFISTGSLPPNAAELLMVSQFKRSLDEWSQAYDLVIVDTPPVLSLSDAQVIGANSGIIFLVTRAELNTIGEVKESIRRMSQVGLKIKGVVFNGLKLRAGRYGYGSKYGRFRYARYAYYSYKNEE
ncbi:MAG: polysaccharide biosynthesis tyrosine autokinase, partial [Janthinobacterium lividum]